MLYQPQLHDSYYAASDAELGDRIAARRRELGDRLLILGHHYQQDDVIRHADFTGDSLKLSQIAASVAPARGSEFIVFCGVHFLAETADILTPDSVRVLLPDLSAGCSMADMAAYDDAVDAWDCIARAIEGVCVRVVPITYVNSSAAVKAFVGERGGACCTSSNAAQVFDWALRGGEQPLRKDEQVKILFLPDQHLGRNTAKSKGFVTELDALRLKTKSDCALWNPRKESGGLSASEIRGAKVLLWAGHCSVHKLFRPEHVQQARAEKRTVIVHPECAQEVVDIADMRGSTEHIINTIESAPVGSRWALGTEVHLVNRVAAAAALRGVDARILSECQCLCTTMYRIDQQHLAWVLDELVEGNIVNEIRVHSDARRFANLALGRMLANVAATNTLAQPIAIADGL